MTWKEFKDIVEKQNVTDSTEISYIDVSYYFSDKITVMADEDGESVHIS